MAVDSMSEVQSQQGDSPKRLSDVDRKSVLVIDDDLPLRGMLAAALRQAGFQVLLAGDRAEGHRGLTIHHPDVIILDLAMPHINRSDVLAEVEEGRQLRAPPDNGP